MNIVFHKENERGKANMDWLNTKYSFSFANYFNRERMGFGTLRVLNEDIIAPDSGFDTHHHDNMEIITIPLSGSISHKDTMGNAGTISKNDIQTMSAGSGVLHSEKNSSALEETHLLQIWIETKEQNIPPFYDQKTFDPQKRYNRFDCFVSPGDIAGSAIIHQDAYLSWGEFSVQEQVVYGLKNKEHGVYLFVISGSITLDNTTLSQGDAAGITDATEIVFSVDKEAFVLMIEVPLQ